MKLLKTIGITAAIIYLLAAFIQLNFNVATWGLEARFCTVLTLLFIVGICRIYDSLP